MNNVSENNTNERDMLSHLKQLAAQAGTPNAGVAVASGEAVAVDQLFYTERCTFCTTDSPEHAA